MLRLAERVDDTRARKAARALRTFSSDDSSDGEQTPMRGGQSAVAQQHDPLRQMQHPALRHAEQNTVAPEPELSKPRTAQQPMAHNAVTSTSSTMLSPAPAAAVAIPRHEAAPEPEPEPAQRVVPAPVVAQRRFVTAIHDWASQSSEDLEFKVWPRLQNLGAENGF